MQTQTPNLKDFATVADESERTGVSKPQLKYLCRNGRITAFKVSPRLWLIERASLDAYIAKNAELERAGHLRGKRRKKQV